MKRHTTAALMIMVTAVTVTAADPEQLGDMVVTASKVPQTRGNVTQKINVLSEADLSRLVLGNRNIAEALVWLPGSSITVLSRNDANWGSYGGIGPKYSTWMLSGLPIDSFVDPQSLDTWAIERVEAQRGPASVLYPNYLSQDFAGNQSPLAGTVNLILREKVDDPLTRVTAEYGSWDTIAARLYHQNRIDKVHFFAGVSYEESDYTDYGTSDSWLNMIDDPEYEKTRMYLGTTFYLGEDPAHRLNVFVNRTVHEGDTGRPNRGYDHEYSLVNGAYSVPLSDTLTAQAKLGFRRYDRTWEEDNFSDGDLGLASLNGVEQDIVPGDVTFSLVHGQNNLLTAGGDFQTADYETFQNPVGGARTTGNDSESSQYGLFVQEEVVVDEWVLRLGGRLTTVEHDIDLLGGSLPGKDSQSWDELLWNAGARYNAPGGVSPFANIGTSFLAPGLKSVGGTLKLEDRGVAGMNGQLPNPDLESESGLGADLGVDYPAAPGLFLGARGFLNIIDDAIVENVVSESPSQSQSINAGETTSLGVEAVLRHRLNEHVQWFCNYTYTDSEVQNRVDPDQDGARVPFVPEHTGNIGADFTLPSDVYVGTYLHLAGGIYDSTSLSNRRKFDSYEVLNIKLRKLLVVRGEYDLEFYIDLYNVTDNQYEMPWQFQDPGFHGAAGLTAAF